MLDFYGFHCGGHSLRQQHKRPFTGRFCKFNLQSINVLAVQTFGKGVCDTLPPSFLTIKKGVLFAALSLDRTYRFRCHEKRR